MNKFFLLNIFFALFIITSCAQDNGPKIQNELDPKYIYETVIHGIDIPWGMTFISKNEMLVTEKSGILYHVAEGQKTEVSGLPDIYVRGQGGLLDVIASPDFKTSNTIFFTASSADGEPKGGHTALYSAQLEGKSLVNLKQLYKGEENSKKGQHWGSRISFDAEGKLYFSIGDRGNRTVNPQDLTRDGGKIYRINQDGSIPTDNPFYDQEGSKKAIYSYGHRNPQGMLTHPETGAIWVHEHGPRGGDEINIIGRGNNYGWPEITHGINYSGTPITSNKELPGMEQPLYYWLPSIAPSGMTFSTSDNYPYWKGNLLVGSLVFEYLERLVFKDNKVVERHKILEGVGRVRNVKQGPDGLIYIGVEGKGILKIIPQPPIK
jgi:glucose/arabinose dehydrogenase